MRGSWKAEITVHTGRATGRISTGNMLISWLKKEMPIMPLILLKQLEKLRTDAEKDGNTFIYNAAVRVNLHNSLSLPEAEWKNLLSQGESLCDTLQDAY